MNLQIQTGHRMSGDVQNIDSDRVRFVTKDGQTMFSVLVIDDQRIEIQAVDLCKVGTVLHDNALELCPKTRNNLIIKTSKYYD